MRFLGISVNIFERNCARLFSRLLSTSPVFQSWSIYQSMRSFQVKNPWKQIHLLLYLRNIRGNDRNENFKNEYCNWTNIKPVALMLQCCVRRLSVVCTECIVAKWWYVLEQKLLLTLTAYRKSYMRNRLVPKWMTDLCLEVVWRSRQPLRYIRRWISWKPLEIEAWLQTITNRKWLTGNRMVTWRWRRPNTLRVQYLESLLWGSTSAILATSWLLVKCFHSRILYIDNRSDGSYFSSPFHDHITVGFCACNGYNTIR